MSSFSTSLVMLALAAIGMAGWQASRPAPGVPDRIEIPADPILAAALPGQAILPARLVSEPARRHLVLPPDLGPNGLPCGLQVDARSEPPAMLILDIQDACQPETEYRIQHGGLTIGLRSDAQGRLRLALPALSDPARIEVQAGGDLRDALTLDVPDLASYHRAVLAWDGNADLALHAHERGATDNAAGHIHPGTPGRARDAILGHGGFLSVLAGADGRGGAHVYTYPRDAVDGTGLVRLSVVLQQTAAHCGRRVDAERHQTLPDGGLTRADMQIDLPACSATVGQTRLQNLFQDLRITAR